MTAVGDIVDIDIHDGNRYTVTVIDIIERDDMGADIIVTRGYGITMRVDISAVTANYGPYTKIIPPRP